MDWASPRDLTLNNTLERESESKMRDGSLAKSVAIIAHLGLVLTRLTDVDFGMEF